MIIGIGTDIADIKRIEKTLAEHGDRFVARIFAPEEAGEGAAHYAKRWAAKEAAAKALGCGIRDGIHMKDFVVTKDAAGKPSLKLEGGAAARLTAITPPGKTASIQLSLADDAGMALAFVVISV